MTTDTQPAVQSEDSTPPAPGTAGGAAPAKQLAYLVAGHVTRLQGAYLEGVPAARATLAELRRGLGRPPGSVPAIWADTIGILPESMGGRDDRASRAEVATHIAVTLYALHQQGQAQPMHVPGVGLGSALQRLRGAENRSAEAVDRRFLALATASDLSEAAFHLRGLVTQLSGTTTGLDYGRLAGDLLDLATPGRETGVRLRWGRQFHAHLAPTVTNAEATESSLDPDQGAIA